MASAAKIYWFVLVHPLALKRFLYLRRYANLEFDTEIRSSQ